VLKKLEMADKEATPPTEKARLRRGIAFETLELKGKAAADMVLLLIEKPDQLQARECLVRCVETLPAVCALSSMPGMSLGDGRLEQALGGLALSVMPITKAKF
jgi:hypothetical protein